MSEMDRGDTVENRSEKAKKRQRYKQGARTMAGPGPCQTTAQDPGGDPSDGTEEQKAAMLPTPQQWLTAEKGQAGDEGGGSCRQAPFGYVVLFKTHLFALGN